MGFGILFFGYFLLLNLTYSSFTDLIAALIMALALNKLSEINRPFKNGFFASLVFALLGLIELVLAVITMFAPTVKIDSILSYIMIPRYFVIAVLTLFILLGIEAVSKEVGLTELAKKARFTMPFVLAVYGISAILDVPFKSPAVIKVFTVISFITIISTFIIIAVNLVTIYRAYAKICMPEDKDNDCEDKPSRFGFVNKYREHNEEKQREYAQYRYEKTVKKMSKKKKKK